MSLGTTELFENFVKIVSLAAGGHCGAATIAEFSRFQGIGTRMIALDWSVKVAR